MKNKFLIFTKRVLPLSNTFVANQAKFLSDYYPVFTGFSKDPSGLSLISDRERCVLAEHSSLPKWDKFLLEGFSRVPAKWKAAMKNYSPAFIHAHFGKGGYYAASIADALSIPLITTFHGSDITEKDKFSYNQKHREVVFDRAEKIFASSQFIANKLLERGCPEKKLQLHYIGIDNQFFSPKRGKSEKPTILFVGRLIKQKGCDFLIKAMSVVSKSIPEAQLLVAGDGVEMNSLKSLANGNQNIQFLGSQNSEQIKNLLDQAWVMCAPSIVLKRGNEEGLGMVFLEAQAMGTPVVSFKTGGVVEAVDDQKTGILVEEGSVEKLAEALVCLLESNQKRQEFSRAGIERVDSKFNLKKQTKTFERFYDDVANSH